MTNHHSLMIQTRSILELPTGIFDDLGFKKIINPKVDLTNQHFNKLQPFPSPKTLESIKSLVLWGISAQRGIMAQLTQQTLAETTGSSKSLPPSVCTGWSLGRKRKLVNLFGSIAQDLFSFSTLRCFYLVPGSAQLQTMQHVSYYHHASKKRCLSRLIDLRILAKNIALPYFSRHF